MIVMQEVRRACESTSLIPAVNKLGTVPLLLSASEELKRKYLPPVARGQAMFGLPHGGYPRESLRQSENHNRLKRLNNSLDRL